MDQQILQALANPTRWRILKLLQQGSTTYSDIMRLLGLDLEKDRGKFTYHLNLLKQTKLIREEGGLYQLTDLGRTVLTTSEATRSMTEGIPPGAQSDIDTARGLTFAAILVAGIFGFLVFSFGAFAVPVIFIPILVGVGIALVFPLLIYLLVYRPLREGRVEDALTPALVLGILALLFAGIVPGILLIIAYVKAKDARTEILSGWQYHRR